MFFCEISQKISFEEHPKATPLLSLNAVLKKYSDLTSKRQKKKIFLLFLSHLFMFLPTILPLQTLKASNITSSDLTEWHLIQIMNVLT